MRIQFTRISAENFLSYREFDLEFLPGQTLLSGLNTDTGSSNASGKSSIVEAILFAIYKKTPRDPRDPTHKKGGNLKVSLEFRVAGHGFRIDRYLKHREFESQVHLFRDGENVSHRLSSMVDAEIAKLIPLSYETFISTVLIAQGMPVNFSRLSPTPRKVFFEEVVQMGIWDSFRENLGPKIKSLDKSLKIQSASYAALDKEVATLRKEIEVLSSITSDRELDIQSKIKDQEFQLAEIPNLDSQAEALDRALQKIQALGVELRMKERAVESAKESLINSSCMACNRPFEQSHIEAQRAAVVSLTEELQILKDLNHRAVLRSKKLEVYERERNARETARAQVNTNLTRLAAELASLSQSVDIQGKSEKLMELASNANAVQEQLLSLESKRESLQALYDILSPSGVFRSRVLGGHLETLNRILSQIIGFFFSSMTCRISLSPKESGLEIQCFDGGEQVEFNGMSGGEKRRFDVAIVLSIQKLMEHSSGVSFNLAVFDEVFDSLDASGVSSVLEALEEMYGQEKCIYVVTHMSELKSRFNQFIHAVKRDGVSYLE
jgi:DNA repair exonuclease SbcCD ATPase subunit